MGMCAPVCVLHNALHCITIAIQTKKWKYALKVINSVIMFNVSN